VSDAPKSRPRIFARSVTPLEKKILKKRGEATEAYSRTIRELMAEDKISERVKLATLETLRAEREKIRLSYDIALQVIDEVMRHAP